jgi:signal transduction histidine kinase
MEVSIKPKFSNFLFKMQPTSLIKTLPTHLQKVQTDSSSAEYQKWRHRFLLERLHQAASILIIAYPSFFVLALLPVVALKAAGVSDLESLSLQEVLLFLIKASATELSLLLCLTLLKTPWASCYPSLLFLNFSWSFTLIWQIHATLEGQAHQLNMAYWLWFPIQALLVPVCWRLHLVSQLSPLAYHFGVNVLLGLDPKIDALLYVAANVSIVFFICLIFNLAVYLYERILWTEFELRQQLRVFLHAVSHDLRNPVLGTVMVLKNLLNQPGEKVQVSRSMLERMLESGDRQLDLINSLIDTHAAEVRGVVLHCQPIQLSPLIQSVIADLQPMLAQEQATLTNLIQTELPLVNADPLQLSRVYQNLIANALKHNPPGLSLALDAKLEGDWVCCTVADNGIGMSQQQSAKLFDLYFRGSQKRQSVGLGLGLYLCRQIITAHGGKIGVQTHPGDGATFWFTLPVAV